MSVIVAALTAKTVEMSSFSVMRSAFLSSREFGLLLAMALLFIQFKVVLMQVVCS